MIIKIPNLRNKVVKGAMGDYNHDSWIILIYGNNLDETFKKEGEVQQNFW